MTSTVELVATAEIVMGNGEMIATGEYAADGSPIYRRQSVAIRPGTAFTIDKTEGERLLRVRAAVPAGSEAAAYAISKAGEL